MSAKRVVDTAWSVVWLIVALCIIVPVAISLFEPLMWTIGLILLVLLGLFAIYRVAKAWMAHKYLR